MRTAFVTSAKAGSFADSDLTPDDSIVASHLEKNGITVVPAIWDDNSIDWTSFDCLVFRSCWDYHLKLPEFLRWLDRIERLKIPIWNPLPLIRKNLDKTYLKDLLDVGIRIPATHWITRGSDIDLPLLLADLGWEVVVAKPLCSLGATGTIKFSAANLKDHVFAIKDLIATGDLLLQQFIGEVQRTGELSLVFFGGSYSHAVRKLPAQGDFRVQQKFGGSCEVYDPPQNLVDAARHVLCKTADRSLYARVDGFVVKDEFILGEVELFEPSLYFTYCPLGASRFEEALRRFM